MRGGTVEISLKESLVEGIYHSYGIRVLDIKPVGPVWRMNTPTGVFAVKRTWQQPDLILQLAQNLNRLHTAGFTNTLTLQLTRSGKPFTRILGENYLVSPWIDGEHPDFTNRRQLQTVARLYGRFHRISGTMTYPDKDFKNLSAKTLAEPIQAIRTDFKAKHALLVEIRDFLRQLTNPNRVERQFIKWSEHFTGQAGYCIQQLMKPELEQESHSEPVQGFRHNDSAPRNIIIHNRELYLIDFELASFGPFIQETAKLIVRALQANQWPVELIPLIIEAYGSERELTRLEFQVLPYLCAFPQGFWRLCSQRFIERLPWTETRFYKRLWEITSGEPARVKCLQSILPDLPEPDLSISSRRNL